MIVHAVFLGWFKKGERASKGNGRGVESGQSLKEVD